MILLQNTKHAQLNNKGMSLLEVLIAIVICSILAASVFGFIIAGVRFFKNNSEEVNMQSDAQMAFNQVQDLVIDTAYSVTYAYSSDPDPVGAVEIVSDDEAPSDAAYKFLTLYSNDGTQDVAFLVTWSSAEQKIYYDEYLALPSTDPLGNPIYVMDTVSLLGTDDTDKVMGEHISGFAVDLSRVESDKIVRIDMTFTYKERVHALGHNITLRNQLTVGNAIPPFTTPTPSDMAHHIDGPDELYVEPADVVSVPAHASYTVKAYDPLKAVSQDKLWFMDETVPYATGTGISSAGVLTVSKNQTDDFRIIVQSADGKASKTVTIKVVRVTAVSVVCESILHTNNTPGNATRLVKGDRITLRATATGNYLNHAPDLLSGAKDPSVFQTFDWSTVRGGTLLNSGVTQTNNTISFSLKGSDIELTVGGKKSREYITIRATDRYTKNNPGKYAAPIYGEWDGATDGDDISDFWRRSEGVFSLNYNVSTNGSDSKVYILYRVDRTEIHHAQDHDEEPVTTYFYNNSKSNTRELVMNPNENNFKIIFTKDMSANSDYIYEVTAYVFEKRDVGSVKGVFENDGYMNCYVDGHGNRLLKTSNTLTFTIYRVGLTYNNNYEYNGGPSSGRINTALIYDEGGKMKWAPRMYGLNFKNMNGEVQITMRYTIDATKLESGKTLQYDPYKKAANGSWVKYENNRYTFPGGSDWLRIEGRSDSTLNMKLNDERWNNSLPSRLRLVPKLEYCNNELLYENYIDVYLWNIQVDTSKCDTAFGATQNCYFPDPTWDPNFPGERSGTWYYPYSRKTMNSAGSARNQIEYKIVATKNTNGAGGAGLPTYDMRLWGYRGGTKVDIGVYRYRYDEEMWTKIRNDEIIPNALR